MLPPGFIGKAVPFALHGIIAAVHDNAVAIHNKMTVINGDRVVPGVTLFLRAGISTLPVRLIP